MSEHMHNRITQVETVRFPGGALQILVDSAGQPWMRLRPACRALGLDVLSQLKQMEREPWAATCVMKAQDTRGKQRYFYCLRGDRLAMWLATLTSQCVQPELSERLAAWQCKAADALARWTANRPPIPQPPLPSSGLPLPLLSELQQMIAREVRSALKEQLAGPPRPAPLAQGALRFGILLPRPDAEGWPQLALGVKQCCALVESDCLTSAKMAQLLEYEAEAVPDLVGAAEKLTGRRVLTGRQLGYLLSCAQKRGLVEHDSHLHSQGGYGWSVVDRTSTESIRKVRARSASVGLLPAAEHKAAPVGGA